VAVVIPSLLKEMAVVTPDLARSTGQTQNVRLAELEDESPRELHHLW
jgi:hypothetical protein